ncbi:16S rRNA (guanine(527)-N(7))-methyltransferase RsmG [Occallatibacter riparius]|uniref:Ribosomal RNA small subunit methyltransferase G n=1 Tax=Occallatibacter riparius TaxID=1002689 RepID=A0A9J7BS97_9BACT|nr:16S rRNA (guanine(527)-N(7))-methyltransferase RsmG [Occallatibacter riparius]UWZ85747.1 16S rRNA (guanine(527)-N(7))-methyltransferase RsmG [Occallatibacter riparius]
MSEIEGRAGEDIARRLNRLLAESGQAELDIDIATRFEAYLDLLVRWNARTNLTAIRDEDGILRRHFVESIACAHALPTEIRSLLDLGSGAGFPGIPISLCRPELQVTLAESQGKKAAFLREAVRRLEIPVLVHGSRAETLGRTFDCVALRAVDRMEDAVRAASALVIVGGWLAPLTVESEYGQIRELAGPAFTWNRPVPLPGGDRRVLLLGRREG